jgi:hypothetical protein
MNKIWTTSVLLLLTPLLFLRADELLQNSDFSSGTAHWDGNMRSSSDAGDDSASPLDAPAAGAATQVVIKLRGTDWTKMSQEFDSKAGQISLAVTYTLSSGTQLSTKDEDYNNVPKQVGLDDQWKHFPGEKGSWTIMLCDYAASRATYAEVPLDTSVNGPQTITMNFNAFDSGEKKTLLLAFPPGTGTITISKVSLQDGLNNTAAAITTPSSLQQTNDASATVPPSFDASKNAMPDKLKALGPLANYIEAYFPMSDVTNGCLAWSSKPIGVSSTSQVTIKQDGGRTYADFSTPGARLVFDPPLVLDPNYTFAAWVQTPVASNHGEIWHGSGGGIFLFITDKDFGYKLGKKQPLYKQGTEPLSGWYHVAVTYDGQQARCYINGVAYDASNGVISDDLGTVGSSPWTEFDATSRSAGISEQYIFNRCLTVSEIKQVMEFSKPPGN